jgi:amidohydrolase
MIGEFRMIKGYLEELKPLLLDVFHHLHTHPEVSWQEYKTTSYIANLLHERGIAVQTFEDHPGLVAVLGEGSFCVGLRTDMDALWQEVEGVFQANHSCGHDAHMTMVLGVLLLFQKMKKPLNGKVKFIFQPAEEKGQGALKMIEKGLIDDVHFLYGVHLRPIQELKNGQASAGIIHGAAKFISGDILGEEAHGARPHLGKNSIEVGAALVNELSKIHLDPMVPYSVKMTKFHAGGESSNIIPGHASFHLDLRAQTNEAMELLTNKVEKIARCIAELYDVKIELETKAAMAAAKIDEDAKKIMKKAIAETLGEENALDPIVTTGGEDFHYYTLKKTHVKSTMLGLGCDLKPGLHHPNMTFHHEAMFTGIEILAKTILYTLERGGKLVGDS